jgi:hypothetical protein
MPLPRPAPCRWNLVRARAWPARAVTMVPGLVKRPAQASSTEPGPQLPVRWAERMAPTTTAPREPRAPRSSAHPTTRTPERSTRVRRSAVAQPTRAAARPSRWMRALPKRGQRAVEESRQAPGDSTTVRSGWVTAANRPPNPPMMAVSRQARPRLGLAPAAGRRRVPEEQAAQPTPEAQTPEEARTPAGARPMTGQVQPGHQTTEQRQALREPAVGSPRAPERPSSDRPHPAPVPLPAGAAIPTSAQKRASHQPGPGLPRAIPRSARELRAARRARPMSPGRASPALPPVDPRLARALAVRRRSAQSGSRRGRP